MTFPILLPRTRHSVARASPFSYPVSLFLSALITPLVTTGLVHRELAFSRTPFITWPPARSVSLVPKCQCQLSLCISNYCEMSGAPTPAGDIPSSKGPQSQCKLTMKASLLAPAHLLRVQLRSGNQRKTPQPLIGVPTLSILFFPSCLFQIVDVDQSVCSTAAHCLTPRDIYYVS